MHSLFGVIYMQFDQVSLFLILWVLIIDRYRLLPESQKKEGLFSVVGVRNGSQKVPFYTSSRNVRYPSLGTRDFFIFVGRIGVQCAYFLKADLPV